MHSESILKVIINTWPLILTHAFLLLIHLHDHPTLRRLISFLIIPFLDEPRKPQTDSFLTSVTQRLGAGFVSWAERKVCSLDLPYEARLKPDIWLIISHRAVGVEGFWFVNGVVLQFRMKLFEDGF